MSLDKARYLLDSITPKFVNPTMLKGARILSYEIHQYSAPQPYYTGNISFDNSSEKEATFFKFNKNKKVAAENIFNAAFKLNHDGILKPLFLTYQESDENWILCYEQFNYLVSDRGDALPKNWCDSVSKCMETVNYIHRRKLLHSALSKPYNYAIIEDKTRGRIEIKIIFDGSLLFQNLVLDPVNLQTKKFKDWTDLKDVLEKVVLKALGQREDLALFLKFFDRGSKFSKYENFVDRLIQHPFLKSSEEKLKFLSDLEHALVADTLRVAGKFKRKIEGKHFVKYLKWNEKLSPWLKKIYENDLYTGIIYDVEKIRDLIRFLRNVYVHDKSSKYGRTELEVRKSFPGLYGCLYKYL